MPPPPTPAKEPSEIVGIYVVVCAIALPFCAGYFGGPGLGSEIGEAATVLLLLVGGILHAATSRR